ncbi:hypothetical protein QYM36_003362, partial [Artemia franciscana]
MDNKPTLKKSDALDFEELDVEGKKLSRGISSTVENSNLVCLARNELGSLSWESNANEFPSHTFTLPNLGSLSDGFRQFLEQDLVDRATLNALESCGRLNWWIPYGVGQKLYPLVTTGDGNCLLHAASLGMFGFHDRLLTLRKAVYSFLTSHPSRAALRRRWQWQLAVQNAEAGLIYSKEEWDREWEGILKLATPQPRISGRLETVSEGPDNENDYYNRTYESLEEMHVLALAHVLRRPIIIVADTVLRNAHGEPLAPIPFGGVYMPLEIPASQCHRSPLILAFESAHFSALVTMDGDPECDQNSASGVIPLTDPEGALLPVQFELDPGEELTSNGLTLENIKSFALSPSERLDFLAEYLEVTHVPIGTNDTDPESKRNRKQATTITKQFGSIGKSMGKRLKKNFMESFNTKKRKEDSRSSTPQNNDFIIAAVLHTEKRQEYQQEMINNYLVSARNKYDRIKEHKQVQEMEKSKDSTYHLAEQAALEGPTMCINPGCNMYGTAVTSYMCTSCYARQREEEEERSKRNFMPSDLQSSAMYGVGKSHFFAESTQVDHESASKIPVAINEKDPSLYLSHSTFYQDKKPLEKSVSKKPPINQKEKLPTYLFGEFPVAKAEHKSTERIIPIQVDQRNSIKSNSAISVDCQKGTDNVD